MFNFSEYKRLIDINKIKDDKLLNYFKKVDEIGTSIDGMESSVDYLDVVLSRIG